MDKGTQEEVKPRFSQSDKIKRVKDFITAQYEITSYERMRELINRKLIKPVLDIHIELLRSSTIPEYAEITDEEARAYFEYLLAITAGTVSVSKEGLVEQAYEQLFAFIYAMRSEIKMEPRKRDDVFTYLDLSEYLRNGNRALGEITEAMKALSGKVNKRDDELHNSMQGLETSVRGLDGRLGYFEKSMEERLNHIKTILASLHKWLETYKEPLEWVKSERARIHPANPPSDKDAKKSQ